MDYNLQIIWQKQNEWDMAHSVPALVPVKSSFNFMQIMYPRKENQGL